MPRHISPHLTLAAIAIAALLLPDRAPAANEPYVIIANKSVSIESVSASSLDKLYRGRSKKLPGLEEAIPINAAGDSSAYEAFANRVHDSSPESLRRYWAKEIFSGRKTPPRQMNSAIDLLNYVATTPNAIGYVPKSVVNDSVKAIKLDGDETF